MKNMISFQKIIAIVIIAVIAMGIRMAGQARVPLVCKIPGFNRPNRSGWIGSAIAVTHSQ